MIKKVMNHAVVLCSAAWGGFGYLFHIKIFDNSIPRSPVLQSV